MLLDYAKGNKHQHELRLLWRLLDCFNPTIWPWLTGFCSYVLLALLLGAEFPASFGCINSGRPICARATPGQKGSALHLAQANRLKSPVLPSPGGRTLTKRSWRWRINSLPLRCPGYRPESVTLVTTLLDAQKYPAQDIALLYARRWKIELWFATLKPRWDGSSAL